MLEANATNKIESTIESAATIRPKDFRPSPQLETYYEYNKVPVVPVLPESKTIKGYGIRLSGLPGSAPWLETSFKYNKPEENIQEEEHKTQIRFPTTTNVIPKETQTYGYLPHGPEDTRNKHKSTQHQDSLESSLGIKDNHLYTALSSKPYQFEQPYAEHNNEQFGSLGPPFYGFDSLEDIKPYKEHAHINTEIKYEKPSYPKKQPYHKPDLSILDKGIAPFGALTWKKIIKFLTTFIPLGLLISALTPSVINVTPVNQTHFRGRSQDGVYGGAKQVASSLGLLDKLRNSDCEEKALCEIMLDFGGSVRSREYLKDLLETFVKQ